MQRGLVLQSKVPGTTRSIICRTVTNRIHVNGVYAVTTKKNNNILLIYVQLLDNFVHVHGGECAMFQQWELDPKVLFTFTIFFF
jgi:hypothetical protein